MRVAKICTLKSSLLKPCRRIHYIVHILAGVSVATLSQKARVVLFKVDLERRVECL